MRCKAIHRSLSSPSSAYLIFSWAARRPSKEETAADLDLQWHVGREETLTKRGGDTEGLKQTKKNRKERY